MPASIRLLLLVANATRRTPSLPVSSIRQFSESIPRRNKPKLQNVAAFSISEFRTSQPTEITPEQLFESSFLPNAPDTPLDEGLRTLFTRNPAAFYYGNHDFYHLKKNTRIPEICILGRSNVGKSSVVNALANRQTNELARVSKRAGKTRTINAYGFGPPPLLPKELTGAQYKGKEDLPKHTFYLVDMPGYGFASVAEWGRNITLYLTKRTSVKGAILLIDAEAGPKDTDWHALSLLATAGLRTAFVITKADKMKTPDRLHDTISKLLSGIRDIERKLTADSKWSWDREIYVTAVGSHNSAVVNATVTTARLAVARLAGLVEDTQPKEEKGKKWGGNIVSFEDLVYAPSKATTPVSASSPPETDSHHTTDIPTTRGSCVQSPLMSNGEREPRHHNSIIQQYPSRPTIDSSPRDLASRRSSTIPPQACTFHTSSSSYSPDDSPSLSPLDLRRVLDDFYAQLKATENKTQDRVRMKMQALENRTFRSKKDREEDIRIREQKRFPKQTKRIQEIKMDRLASEVRKMQFREQRRRRKVLEEEEAAARPKPAFQEDGEFEDDEDDYYNSTATPKYTNSFAKGSGSKAKNTAKQAKGKGKGKNKVEEELDPFEAQFLNKSESRDDDGRGRISSF